MGTSMRVRILLALALVLALVVAAPAATGATKKKRTLQGTIHMAVIGPNGTGSKFAGEFAGKPLGRAALLFQNTVANNTSTGKAVIYTKKGTIRANATNQLQPQPDGSVNVPGSFKITGGTGRYKGATGSGSFDGVLPANSEIFEITVKGKIRY
jgi:hypothetical protein